MPREVVEVEEVSGRVAFRRFIELPHLLHRGEPRWSAPVAAWDRARLDPHRNPFFDEGDGAYFLARRLGRLAGRITAHVASDDDPEGCFGFFEAVDDQRVVDALVAAAAAWLTERGCTSVHGPLSFTAAEEAGLLVEGFDVAGTTGRPWHPPSYAEGLGAAGFERLRGSERPTWRLAATAGAPGDGAPPELAGPYGDRRIVFDGVAAAPDLTAQGSPLQLAKRARRGDWEGCTVVRCDGDPATLVPLVQGAAGAAGYGWVVAPWSPEPDAPPETVHALFRRSL